MILNDLPEFRQPMVPADSNLFAPSAVEYAARLQQHYFNMEPTPLLERPDLARQLGLGGLSVKDEGQRLGLGSFKALGGAYAVLRLVAEKAGLPPQDLLGTQGQRANLAETASDLTFCCATDGNHGRSVAFAASLLNARCVIFLHEGVHQDKADLIASEGAELLWIKGSYDDAVAASREQAERNNWILVSDTSWPGYEAAPRLIMQGYCAMAQEALDAFHDAPPTHVFLQAGVGGLAAAVAGFYTRRLQKHAPKFVIVEPTRAACLYQSAQAGAPVQVEVQQPTNMAMLECYEPSMVAWRILSRVAHAFVQISEEEASAATSILMNAQGLDTAISATPSSAAGLAGLIKVCSNSTDKERLGLTQQSRVLVFNTESQPRQ